MISYDAAISINSEDATTHYNRGIVLGKWGQSLTGEDQLTKYSEAVASFDNAIRINPADVNAYYNRGAAFWIWGMAYAEQGDFAHAAELMQVLVDYEREIGHSDAEKHAEQVEDLRRRAAAGE